MFLGSVIVNNGSLSFRTVDGELLVFLWKGEKITPDNLWSRMLTSDPEPVMFAGIRVGNTLNALRRV